MVTLQLVIALPSMITVQAPQSRLSQPYFVPVRLDASRSAHKSGVDGSSLYCTASPFTVIRVMAVGNIYEPDHANSILAAGRADLVALARPHLVDPFWTLRAAAQLNYRDVHCPPQYLNGLSQLARNLQREAEAAGVLRV